MMNARVLLAVMIFLSSVASFAAEKATLEKARAFYNKKQYQRAIEIYSTVPKQSDYYVDALEEKAQALGQLGKYAESLSELKSTMAPQFVGLVGAEAYLTAVITQLKTCDYVSVLETSKRFKKDFSSRIASLSEIASKAPSKIRQEAFAKANKAKSVSVESLGPLVRQLPRHTTKDKKASSLTKNSAGFENRLRQLADAELKEIDVVISRLQIAEVEVEHRLNVLAASGKRRTQGVYEKSNDVLVFPDDETDVWFDEIGNYQAQVETCPDLSRRAGL